MAIRTFWIEDDELNFGTGGGITYDSDPEGEWAETELKAQHLLRVAAGPRPDEPVGAATMSDRVPHRGVDRRRRSPTPRPPRCTGRTTG